MNGKGESNIDVKITMMTYFYGRLKKFLCFGLALMGSFLFSCSEQKIEEKSENLEIKTLPSLDIDQYENQTDLGIPVRGFDPYMSKEEPGNVMEIKKAPPFQTLSFIGFFKDSSLIIYKMDNMLEDRYHILDLDSNEEVGTFESLDIASHYVDKQFVSVWDYNPAQLEEFATEHFRIEITHAGKKVVEVTATTAKPDVKNEENNTNNKPQDSLITSAGSGFSSFRSNYGVNTSSSSLSSHNSYSSGFGLSSITPTDALSSSSNSTVPSSETEIRKVDLSKDNASLNKYVVSTGFTIQMVSNQYGKKIPVYSQTLPDAGDSPNFAYYILDKNQWMIITPNFRYRDRIGAYSYTFFIVKIRPYYAQLLNEKGEEYSKSENWKSALECFQKSIYLYPEKSEYYMNAAICSARLQEREKRTIRYLKEFMKRDKNALQKIQANPVFSPYLSDVLN